MDASRAAQTEPHSDQDTASWTDPRGRIRELLEFARRSRAEVGFGRLSNSGELTSIVPETTVNARMAFSFATGAVLFGEPGYRDLAAHGLAALRGPLHDRERGGYRFSLADQEGRKNGYELCFVALAAATGLQAGVAVAAELLADATALFDRGFWNDDLGCVEQSFDPALLEPEDYVGGNVNMHAVEAFTAIAAATGDRVWLDRALRIADRVVNRVARADDWMLPEHFARDWSPVREYNADRKSDEFRPYGVTVGHLFEWSRLTLELEAALTHPPGWMREAARSLYDTAVRLGWSVDGEPGFVYTLDWTGAPLVRGRMHWVCCEAIAAAGSWAQLGHSEAGEHLEAWRTYADRFLVDSVEGSWFHELDERNRPTEGVFSGKPDAYHILQALVVPTYPIASSMADRISAGRRQTLRPLLDAVAALRDASSGERVIIGIVGAPGAGKSTLSTELAGALGAQVAIVPMDGFHISQRQLEQLGRAARKGAPDTFDVAGFVSMLARLRTEREAPVFAPEFDRRIEDSIAAAIRVDPDIDVVITEGNYLLHDEHGWGAVADLIDEVWFLDLDDTVRRQRLVARHIDFGKAPDAAADWVDQVDEANARAIGEFRERARRTVRRGDGDWIVGTPGG